MNDTISVLVAARKNSKYLAKFLFGYFQNTIDTRNTEILVILNADDTWNKELVAHFTPLGVKFSTEDYKLGRAGLAIYFDDLYKKSTGEWVIYFCEDHFIIEYGWDRTVRQLIRGTLNAEKGSPDQPDVLQNTLGALDPKKIWCLVPKFDNAGSMNQILSRPYIDTMGTISRHGNLDSYINDVNTEVFGDTAIRRPNYKSGDRVIRFDKALFHDFTHDRPTPMDDAHLQSVIGPEAKTMPKYDDPIITVWVAEDAAKIRAAIEAGL